VVGASTQSDLPDHDVVFRSTAARGHIEVVPVIRVGFLQLVERVVRADRRVNRRAVFQSPRRIDRAPGVAEFLMDFLEDTERQGRRWRGRRVKVAVDTVDTGGDLVTVVRENFLLVSVRPDPLGVFRHDAGNVLDLIHDLPLELQVVQADVRRIDRSFLQADGFES
jgi:hypothetical protein